MPGQASTPSWKNVPPPGTSHHEKNQPLPPRPGQKHCQPRGTGATELFATRCRSASRPHCGDRWRTPVDLGADLRPLPPSLEQIRTHRVTHDCGAPIVHSMLADAPNQSGIADQISGLRAGAAPPLAVFERMADIGVALTRMYGLTET